MERRSRGYLQKRNPMSFTPHNASGSTKNRQEWLSLAQGWACEYPIGFLKSKLVYQASAPPFYTRPCPQTCQQVTSAHVACNPSTAFGGLGLQVHPKGKQEGAQGDQVGTAGRSLGTTCHQPPSQCPIGVPPWVICCSMDPGSVGGGGGGASLS